jgi:hypothetical protein
MAVFHKGAPGPGWRRVGCSSAVSAECHCWVTDAPRNHEINTFSFYAAFAPDKKGGEWTLRLFTNKNGYVSSKELSSYPFDELHEAVQADIPLRAFDFTTAQENPASKRRRKGKKLEKAGWRYGGSGYWTKVYSYGLYGARLGLDGFTLFYRSRADEFSGTTGPIETLGEDLSPHALLETVELHRTVGAFGNPRRPPHQRSKKIKRISEKELLRRAGALGTRPWGWSRMSSEEVPRWTWLADSGRPSRRGKWVRARPLRYSATYSFRTNKFYLGFYGGFYGDSTEKESVGEGYRTGDEVVEAAREDWALRQLGPLRENPTPTRSGKKRRASYRKIKQGGGSLNRNPWTYRGRGEWTWHTGERSKRGQAIYYEVVCLLRSDEYTLSYLGGAQTGWMSFKREALGGFKTGTQAAEAAKADWALRQFGDALGNPKARRNPGLHWTSVSKGRGLNVWAGWPKEHQYYWLAWGYYVLSRPSDRSEPWRLIYSSPMGEELIGYYKGYPPGVSYMPHKETGEPMQAAEEDWALRQLGPLRGNPRKQQDRTYRIVWEEDRGGFYVEVRGLYVRGRGKNTFPGEAVTGGHLHWTPRSEKYRGLWKPTYLARGVGKGVWDLYYGAGRMGKEYLGCYEGKRNLNAAVRADWALRQFGGAR